LAELTADDFGGPDLEGCNELLVVTLPDAVDKVHRSFFDVGCDVVETDTFGAFGPALAEYGPAHRARDQLGEFHRQFVSELGVSVIGGCCGTTPEHLAAVVAACAGLVPAELHPE